MHWFRLPVCVVGPILHVHRQEIVKRIVKRLPASAEDENNSWSSEVSQSLLLVTSQNSSCLAKPNNQCYDCNANNSAASTGRRPNHVTVTLLFSRHFPG